MSSFSHQPDEPHKPKGYEGNWAQVAWDATQNASVLRMENQEVDSGMLQYAASLQAIVGGTQMKFAVSTEVCGYPPGDYTLSQLAGIVVQAANNGGSSAAYEVQAAQSVFGKAQTESTQDETDAGGFVSSENTTTTSTDATDISQANMVLSAEASFEQQMSQLHISC